MKGINRLTLGVSSIALFMMSHLVNAAMPVPFGWYLEGNLGKSYTNKIFPGRVQNTGLGWNVNGGYKFTQYVAVDVGLTRYAQARVQTFQGTTVATDSHYSYDIAGKFILPLAHSGAEIFGKLGIARINSYTSLTNQGAAQAQGFVFNTGVHSSSGAYFGAGADFAVTPNILTNVQWMRVTGSRATGRADLASAGLSYIF